MRLATVFVAAFALRVGIRAATGVSDYWTDGYSIYAGLARHLAAGDGFTLNGTQPTAYRVPLYPLFIAAVTWGGTSPWPLIVAQSLVSSGLAVLSGLMARHCYGPAAGLVAAAWCAAYPYFAWHDVGLEESGLFAALTALATWLLLLARTRRGAGLALLAGLALGAALLTRAVLLPFALLALVWLALPDDRATRASRRWLTAVLAGAAMVAALTPWLVRSHNLTGSYALGTETGESLYAGASPLLFARFPAHKVDDSRALVLAAIPSGQVRERDSVGEGNPARESQWYTRQAVQMALADPAGYFVRALRKLAIAFGPFPAPRHGVAGNFGYAAWWVPLLAMGLVGAWRDRAHWRRNLLFAAQFAGFTVVTALVWAQTSHRAYLDVYLMVLGAPVLLGLLPRRVEAWLR